MMQSVSNPISAPVQLRRGAEKVRVCAYDDSMSTQVTVVVEAPGSVTLERVVCGKRKEARQCIQRMVDARLAAGFEPDDAPWESSELRAAPTWQPPQGARLIPVPEALALCAAVSDGFAALFTNVVLPAVGSAAESVLVFEAGLTLDAWRGDAPFPVLVVGDLVCTGAMVDEVGAATFVGGDVRCGSLVLSGEFCCAGAVTVRDFVVVGSSNDASFHVEGRLTAPLFFEQGTASYAQAFDAEVWRCINEVHDTNGLLPRTPPSQRSVERLRALGWSPEAIDALLLVAGPLARD